MKLYLYLHIPLPPVSVMVRSVLHLRGYPIVYHSKRSSRRIRPCNVIMWILQKHKKEDKMDVTKFRPISLFTFFSKILEKSTYTRLYQHINQNNILATKQYGFRNNCSTEKAPLKLINEILLVLNNILTVGGIFVT